MAYFKISLTVALSLLCSACGTRAPSFLLLGSYFPSWLIGLIISIPLTVLIRLGLIKAGIDDVLPLRLFIYTCVALIFTMIFAFIFSPR